MLIAVVFLFFFFSSRRRHTRCYRDWSSDVCSSDLPSGSRDRSAEIRRPRVLHTLGLSFREAAQWNSPCDVACFRIDCKKLAPGRSEERRVGKETRWRGSRSDCKTKKHSDP